MVGVDGVVGVEVGCGVVLVLGVDVGVDLVLCGVCGVVFDDGNWLLMVICRLVLVS